jgi:hypothetical protein
MFPFPHHFFFRFSGSVSSLMPFVLLCPLTLKLQLYTHISWAFLPHPYRPFVSSLLEPGGRKIVSIQYLYDLCGISCSTETNTDIQVPFLLCSKFAEYDKARSAKSVQWLCYRLDHMGFKSWQRQESYRFSETFRPDLGPTRLLFKGTGGYFPGAMWLVHWDHQSPPSTAKVKNEWSYTTTPPHMHSQHVQGQLFLSFHCTFSFPSFYTQIKYTIHKYISKYDVNYTAFHHLWRQ